MRRFLFHTFIYLFLIEGSLAQVNRIDTLKIRLASSFADNSEAILMFPKFRLKRKSLEDRVNMEMKEQITNREFEGKSIEQSYRDWAQYFSQLGFNVLLNQKDWVSLELFGEYCGAHCSSFYQYLTVNLSDGKFYSIDEIVDTTGEFRNQVYSKLDSVYQVSKVEILNHYKLDTLNSDTSYLPILLEELDNCKMDFKMLSYSMTPNCLIVRKNCEFPHYMRDWSPFWELKFNWVDIRSYLKISMK